MRSATEDNITPISELDVNLIKTMVNNYKSNQLRFVEDGLKKPDTQSIWFDLETLKSFVAQIEKNTKANDSTINTNQLGIRMYYASYPAKEDMVAFEDLRETPQEYEKMQTLIMIPTIKIEKSNVDYNPLDAQTYSTGIKNIEQNGLSNSSGTTETRMALTSIEKTAAQNHGSLCPPDPIIGQGF